MIFSPPPITGGHPKPDAVRSEPASIGLAAAARLRGTAVTLAAAARSPGVTQAPARTVPWRTQDVEWLNHCIHVGDSRTL